MDPVWHYIFIKTCTNLFRLTMSLFCDLYIIYFDFLIPLFFYLSKKFPCNRPLSYCFTCLVETAGFKMCCPIPVVRYFVLNLYEAGGTILAILMKEYLLWKKNLPWKRSVSFLSFLIILEHAFGNICSPKIPRSFLFLLLWLKNMFEQGVLSFYLGIILFQKSGHIIYHFLLHLLFHSSRCWITERVENLQLWYCHGNASTEILAFLLVIQKVKLNWIK